MAHVTVLLSQKGGVGKSTLTVNLAAVTAEVAGANLDPDASSPVAAISIDPQGSALWWSARVGENLPFHVVQADGDIEGLRNLRAYNGVDHIFVDTPGWLDPEGTGDSADPLGDGAAGDSLRAVLSCADQVVVPITPEPLSFDPTVRTIRKVIEPRGLPYTVVLNNWDPRDGTADRDETIEFVRGSGFPITKTVIRRYKLHTRASANGQVVTDFPSNGTALRAREDFFRLALELRLGGQ